MWGLFFLLFPFVLRIRKQDAPMDVFRYGVVTVVFAIAFSAGFVMNSAFSLVAIFASAVQFYYFVGIKWSKSYPSDKSALCLVYQIVISGFLFWTAQYTAGLFCFLLLLASSACMGFVAIRHYRRTHSVAVSILVFLVCSFVLPSISIGYNRYNGIETKRWFNCRTYHYSSRGLLYELGDEAKGIRHTHHLSSINSYMVVISCPDCLGGGGQPAGGRMPSLCSRHSASPAVACRAPSEAYRRGICRHLPYHQMLREFFRLQIYISSLKICISNLKIYICSLNFCGGILSCCR